MESEEDEDEAEEGSGSPEEWASVVRELQSRLDDLQTCSDLIAKHGAALQRSLSELENNTELETIQKAVKERATLFRIASNAMINVSEPLVYSFFIPMGFSVNFSCKCKSFTDVFRLFANSPNPRTQMDQVTSA